VLLDVLLLVLLPLLDVLLGGELVEVLVVDELDGGVYVEVLVEVVVDVEVEVLTCGWDAKLINCRIWL